MYTNNEPLQEQGSMEHPFSMTHSALPDEQKCSVRSRPRSYIQLITVSFVFAGDKLEDVPPPFDHPAGISRHAMWEFAREVDWPSVAAMVQ
jgi:hypothetical protein